MKTKQPRYLFAFFVLLLLIFCISPRPKDETPQETPLTDRFDAEIQDFAFILPNLEPIEGIGGFRAADCGICHKTIYEEWQKSTHASALRDIQFQSEITKEDSPKWLCLNCHIPLQNQRKHFVTGLVENDVLKPVTRSNPQFDPILQKEAVTCATCHVRRDEVSGKSIIIGPNGSEFAPHPIKQDRAFLNNICQRCHNPQGERLTRNLVCWFESTKELAEAEQEIKAVFGATKGCVDCHMPPEQRLVADIFPDLPLREVNQHNWVGSGIPKWYEGYDQLLERGYQSALDVQVGEVAGIRAGENIEFQIRLKNARAGHYLTTGDPERFILAIAELKDASGGILVREKLRIGQEWLWSPARKVGDNRLKQSEERSWNVSASLPRDLSGISFTVTVYHVRLNSETAKHIIAAEGVDEALFENGAHYVENAIDFYPFANVVFKEELNLDSETRRTWSAEELIALSKAESGKPLSSRDY